MPRRRSIGPLKLDPPAYRQRATELRGDRASRALAAPLRDNLDQAWAARSRSWSETDARKTRALPYDPGRDGPWGPAPGHGGSSGSRTRWTSSSGNRVSPGSPGSAALTY